VIPSSPFLGREVRQDDRRSHQFPSDTAAWKLAEERAKSKLTLEKLRYRTYMRGGLLGIRIMQTLGDFGRKWFPFIGRGWDGIGPSGGRN
jgi:hypothetical protein